MPETDDLANVEIDMLQLVDGVKEGGGADRGDDADDHGDHQQAHHVPRRGGLVGGVRSGGVSGHGR